jgi:tetratricopeptide (TPR) repeat protein
MKISCDPGGRHFAIGPWFGICQALEECGNHERALSEYENLVAAYPAHRQGLMAQLAAARICLKRLNRPEDALKYFPAAAASAVPHLDLENTIQAGVKEATSALCGAAGVGK